MRLTRERVRRCSPRPLLTRQTLRYVSELTKFGVVPVHTILHMVKVAVEDFTFHNITSACILLEHCGRCLLRTDATRDRMAQFVRRGIAQTRLIG